MISFYSKIPPCGNKVIIVTGGGTGIGRSTCIELAKTGIKQVIGNRNEEKGNEVVEIIRKNGLTYVSYF